MCARVCIERGYESGLTQPLSAAMHGVLLRRGPPLSFPRACLCCPWMGCRPLPLSSWKPRRTPASRVRVLCIRLTSALFVVWLVRGKVSARLGKFRCVHSYLWNSTQRPTCAKCGGRLSAFHVLVKFAEHNADRHKHFSELYAQANSLTDKPMCACKQIFNFLSRMFLFFFLRNASYTHNCFAVFNIVIISFHYHLQFFFFFSSITTISF